jgi:glycine/D-amino acid oxidase-like deaminating enzyme
MKSHARVVIVGGGIMGVGLLYHLALEGWADVVLLEKAELTSGSTWHAAGQCPHFNSSLNATKLHVYGTRLYAQLDALTGHAVTRLGGGCAAIGCSCFRCHCERSRAIPRGCGQWVGLNVRSGWVREVRRSGRQRLICAHVGPSRPPRRHSNTDFRPIVAVHRPTSGNPCARGPRREHCAVKQ